MAVFHRSIDSIYNDQINALLEKQVASLERQDILYSICYLWEDEEEDEEGIERLAFFSTKEKAKKALRELLKIPELKSIANQLEVFKENIHRKHCEEGFITWAPTPKERKEWNMD